MAQVQAAGRKAGNNAGQGGGDTSVVANVQAQVIAWINELQRLFVERNNAIWCAVLCALRAGGGNFLMLGPPGVGKTRMIKRLARSVQGSRYVYRLMYPDMTPADCFGYPDMNAALAGRYTVLRGDTMQDGTFTFMDECYKAGEGVVLNRTLSLLEGREVDYGGTYMAAPNLLLVALASNELPQNKAILDAFDDRIDMRLWIPDVQDPANFRLMLDGNTEDDVIGPSLDALLAARDAAAQVQVGPDVKDLLTTCRTELDRQKGIQISPRKWMRYMGILRVQAWLGGRTRVIPEDVGATCGDTLWREQQERSPIIQVMGRLADPVGATAQEVLDAATLAYQKALEAGEPSAPGQQVDTQRFLNAAVQANRAFGEQRQKLGELAQQYPGHARLREVLTTIDRYHTEISRRLRQVAGMQF